MIRFDRSGFLVSVAYSNRLVEDFVTEDVIISHVITCTMGTEGGDKRRWDYFHVESP